MKKRSQSKRILVTGGPTRAYLDPVRFLSNISTGALAFVLCKELQRQGFEVAAVIGPTNYPFKLLKLRHFVSVETNEEMGKETLRLCKSFKPDAAIFSAAVLDFAPASKKAEKVSSSNEWTLRLKPTPKIVDQVAKRFPKIARVGFKLESRKVNANFGHKLLKAKGLRALIVNRVSEVSAKTHSALLFSSENAKPVRAKTKESIAKWICWELSSLN